jgi:hypothetical protein
MNKFRNAAITILEEANKPLHYREITQLALEKGILETDGATPEASMNAQIVMDIKNKGKGSVFIKVSPAIFSLNPNKEQINNFKKIEEEEQEENEKIAVESGFTGKAGEHFVCSELLFRGINASIMSVDMGLDIVATKDNKMFGIQVKTANINKFNIYVFDIRKVSFERHDSGNIFYIFVLKGVEETNTLILPFHELEKKIYEKAILEIGNGKRYRINMKFRDGNIYLGTKEHEVNYYLNNWDIVK